MLATQIGDKIKLMSFGKDLLDESMLFAGLSTTHREQGALGPAYEWAQAAVKEVDNDNERDMVDVLCSASLAYAMVWNVKKAEQLILQAVRTARFGIKHPSNSTLYNYISCVRHDVMLLVELRTAKCTHCMFARSSTWCRSSTSSTRTSPVSSSRG